MGETERNAVNGLLKPFWRLTKITDDYRQLAEVSGRAFGEWFQAAGDEQRQVVQTAFATVDAWKETTPAFPDGIGAECQLLVERVEDVVDRPALLALLDVDAEERRNLLERLRVDGSLHDVSLMRAVEERSKTTHAATAGILDAVTLLHNQVLDINARAMSNALRTAASRQGLTHTSNEQRDDDGSLTTTVDIHFDPKPEPRRRHKWWPRRNH